MTETHTYPDGSQRVGSAPFQKLSPLEEQAAKLREGTLPAEPVADLLADLLWEKQEPTATTVQVELPKKKATK